MSQKKEIEDASDPLVDSFLEYLSVERNSSPRTLTNYAGALSRFRTWHSSFPGWKKVDPDDFRDYLYDCMKEELARSTIRLHFAALRSFYRYLTRRQGLAVNPVLEVQLPKPEKKLPVVLTQAQVVELIEMPFQAEQPKQAP
ncbi:MAG: site-specific integrase, partial [Verrucomicrobiota bacterium]